MGSKPVRKLLQKWQTQYESRTRTSGAAFTLAIAGTALSLEARIGSLARGAKLDVVEAAAPPPAPPPLEPPRERPSPPSRDALETGDFARAPPDARNDELFQTRRLLRIAERDAGARLGCSTARPCRVGHVARARGSAPFAGLDPRAHVKYEVLDAASRPRPVEVKISVVCPTTSCRASFHPLLYENFRRQTHGDRELVVYSTGPTPSPFFGALEDGRVTYFHEDRRVGLGEKRNVLVRRAKGAIIACFDDDNIYAPTYLAVMASHLTSSGARCACLARWATYSVAEDGFYAEGAKWSGMHHTRSVNGETLVYFRPDPRSPILGDVARYPPDRDVDEDREALFPALTHDLDDGDGVLFLHMEHGRNTVPADSWDNCVEFRRPVARSGVAAPLLAALEAAAGVIEAVSRERQVRGPPPTRKSPFVPKQRKFKIGKK